MNNDALTKNMDAGLRKQFNGGDHQIGSAADRFVYQDSKMVLKVLAILESRLPVSAHVYNMAKLFDRFFPKIKLYSLNGCLTSEAIILTTTFREDYHQDIQVSVPADFEVTNEIKEAFSSTKAIDWNNSAYLFSTLERSVSPMIIEISTIMKGNSIYCNPNIYFTMTMEDAINLNVEFEDSRDTEIRSLNTEEGIQFLVQEWKYTLPGTEEYVRRIVAKNPSAGLYVEGSNEVLSGIMTNSSGLVGMLSTLQEERQKGYAVAVMRSLLKDLAKEGFIPTSSCEVKNIASVNFHKKVGMQSSHVTDDIVYRNSYK